VQRLRTAAFGTVRWYPYNVGMIRGAYPAFAANSPLWIARYSSIVGTLPAGWSTYSFWQYASSGTFPGDQNVWNGTLARLKVLACDGTC
jgi:GH25 family lysozyme M1 (1,4-beta-N-acetylmuramidase)